MKMKLLGKLFRRLPFSLKCGFVDLLLKIQGVKIKEAKTEEELEQVYRLRYEVYKDEDYIDPEDYSDRRLTDKYEPYSVSFSALKNGEPIGTVRLIHYSNLGFPTKRTFNIIDFPTFFSNDKTMELSKLCIKKSFRKSLISLGLFKGAFEYSEKERTPYWILFTTRELANYFENILGIKLISLPTGPLSNNNIEERKIAGKKYFKKFVLHPYLANIEEIKRI